MEREDLVLASEFCKHHDIELSFVTMLNEHGLIEAVEVDEKIFLPLSELPRLEKILRLHFELDINIEGIETITHMLNRMEEMQKEIGYLRSILSTYEKPDQVSDGIDSNFQD